LGDFSLWKVYFFTEVAPVYFCAAFLRGNSYVLISTWNRLGCIRFGWFFTNLSGHPDSKLSKLCYVLMRNWLLWTKANFKRRQKSKDFFTT
jgi:hypothetical protein